ncbi:MAG: formimidoylglutamase [Balneolaceae bacterium]|nr:formimidoylglutamase [Balneolaceae bacterium]
MSKFHSAHIPVPHTDGDDPRLGPLLAGGDLPEKDLRAVILGFPSEEGVRRNGGRPGAAEAPDAIRLMLYRMTPDVESPGDHRHLLERTRDLGNFRLDGSLAQSQEAFGEVVAGYLRKGVVPVILGGGHETAFAHFSGYATAGLHTAILNLDAHADVRPLKEGMPHSGSPFRQAVEHPSGTCDRYMVAGLQPCAAAAAHINYIREQGGRCLLREETNISSLPEFFHDHLSERLMVTFDMDAVDQAFAPGVSAPCANGLQPDLWLTAAYLAGRNEKVTSFDLSEVNPQFDRDGQTARLGALTVWHFLLGLSHRGR